MSQITVTVNADGSIKIDAQGYKDNSCAKATAALRAALGKVTADEKKPEFLTQAKEQNKATH